VTQKEYRLYIELYDQDSIKYCYMCYAVEQFSGIPTTLYVLCKL